MPPQKKVNLRRFAQDLSKRRTSLSARVGLMHLHCVVLLFILGMIRVVFEVEGFENQQMTQPMLFPLLIHNVLLTDVIWVPSENYVAFISISTKYVRLGSRSRASHREYHAFPLNEQYPHNFSSPLTLEAALRFEREVSVEHCYDVPSKSGDGNVDGLLHIVHCTHTPRSVHGLNVFYQNQQIATLSTSRLNANSDMQFQRQYSKTGSVSVVIKPVQDYHPNIMDILRYYHQQGVDHIYIGVNPINSSAHAQFHERIVHESFATHVSIGGFKNNNIRFIKGTIPFIQSVLYHSKSFDEFLIVHDLDEVMVTAHPTTLRITDVLKNQKRRNETCFLTLQANTVPKTWNSTATSLAERMPYRCDGGSAAYQKSVAVVRNCNYLALHQHGACRSGTAERGVPKAEASILHFTGLWKQRHSSRGCNITSEYTLFERQTSPKRVV